MPERIQISNRARNTVIVVLAVFFFSLCCWSLISTRSWIDRPFPGFLVLENNLVAQIWLPEWEYELMVFPAGKHDDQVDAFSYAALETVAGSPPGPASPRGLRRRSPWTLTSRPTTRKRTTYD